jgi:hypothetical protein
VSAPRPETAAAAAPDARRKGSGGTHKNPTACMPQCRSVLKTHCHIRFD